MSGETKLKVYCVKVITESDETEINCINSAFQVMNDNDFEPSWLTEEECLDIKTKTKSSVFVFSSFKGEAFNNLRSLQYRIFGPQCVLSCLHLKVEIPRKSQPIFNMAMKDLIVSCTNIDKFKREEIYDKVKQMSGDMSKDLTESVTHLIAGEVGSNKYKVAGSLKKNIMMPEWVDKVWLEAKARHVHGSDEEFTRYRCPVFHKLIICVSGFSSAERKHIKTIVEREGGTYTGDLRVNSCTHLLLAEPKGKKYECARRWNIFIVCPDWLHNSVEKGYSLPEDSYLLEATFNDKSAKTSTPEGKHNSSTNMCEMSDISSIPDQSCMSMIQETTFFQSNMTSLSNTNTNFLLNFDCSQVQNKLFLDGCRIYLSGFNKAESDKLRQLINAGGASRFNHISDNLTHMIIGSKVDEDLKTVEGLTHQPYIVTSNWIIDSAKRGFPLPPDNYSDLPRSNITADMSKKPNRNASVKCETFGDDVDDNFMELMSQYLPDMSANNIQGNVQADMSTQDPARLASFNHTTSPGPDETPRPTISTAGDTTLAAIDMLSTTVGSEYTENLATQVGTEDRAFYRKLFSLQGFLSEQHEIFVDCVRQFGGKVISENSRLVPDFVVVPLCGYPVLASGQQVVTNAWLQMCIESETLLSPDSNPLFRPITITADIEPLQGCVLSISGYCGTERDCLMRIAELLGSRCQEYFVRKANKGLEASTHLITKYAEGTKYMAAKKWGVYALTNRWLFDCATFGRRLAESDYCIDITMTSTVMSEDTTKPLSSTLTTMTATTLMTATNTTTAAVNNHGSENIHQNHSNKKLDNASKHVAGNLTPTELNLSSQENHPPDSAPVSHPRSKHKRIRELQDNVNLDSRSPIKPLGIDSPSVFLDPNNSFHPSYQFDNFLKTLESTSDFKKPAAKRESISLSDMYSEAMKNCLAMSRKSDSFDVASQDEINKVSDLPLKGLVISVSRKLATHQAEYNDIASRLGAEYTWTYDDTCTHFIFKGRINDTSKELKIAKEKGKFVVSPHWLFACRDQNFRVDENSFPHSFNPNKVLSVVSSKATPRSSRKAVKTPRRDPYPIVPKELYLEQKISNNHDEVVDRTAVTDAEMMPDVDSTVHPDPLETTKESKPSHSELPPTVAQLSTEPQKSTVSDAFDENSKSANEGAGTGETQNLQVALNEAESVMKNVKLPKRGTRHMNNRLSGQSVSGNSPTPQSKKRPSCDDKSELNSSQQNSGHKKCKVKVVWDDTTGRLEREKHQVFRPSQDIDPEQDHRPHGMEAPAQDNLSRNLFESKNESHVNSPPQRTTTPVTTPVTLGAEIGSVQKPTVGRSQHVFLLSAMNQEEKVEYGSLIERLGGKVLDSQYYDFSCSHLIIGGNPTRNEKFLACVASGKWILHRSYLEACQKNGSFVDEELYEWGGPGTNPILSKCSEQGRKLARAAHKWRLKVQNQSSSGGDNTGAFQGWEVILCTSREKRANFRRILDAGGAKVFTSVPPFPDRASHCFIDMQSFKYTNEELAAIFSSGANCLRPEYISAYLTDEPPPSLTSFCPPEIATYRASISSNIANGDVSNTSNADISISTRLRKR